eukprot:gene8496-320_t
MGKKEKNMTWSEWFSYQWKTAPYRIISIVFVAVTLALYILQVALMFGLFEFWKSPMVILYCSPVFIAPPLLCLAIGLSFWKRLISMCAHFVVSVVNLGAAALLIYLNYSQATVASKVSRLPVVGNYIIFGLVMLLASVGSIVLGVDDCLWYIRWRRGVHDYQKLDTETEEDDLF